MHKCIFISNESNKFSLENNENWEEEEECHSHFECYNQMFYHEWIYVWINVKYEIVNVTLGVH